MKIFTAEQIRKCDEFTISDEPVSSIQLMERVAQSCVDWIYENCKNHRNFTLFCGSGNNGGDGFAIAKMLYLKGFDVDVFVDPKAKYSSDANVNFRELKEVSGVLIKNFKDVESYRFDSRTVIIDALFGTGLSRELDKDYKQLVNDLNSKNNVRISIDIPSGLFTDVISDDNSTIFKADYTLSFQFWKKSFLHPETGKYTGKVVILDINLSEEYISNTATTDFVIDDKIVENIFKPRNEFSHKGTYGKVTIAAGSYGKVGAAVLATKSALRTGAGLTFTLAPKCGYEILQTSCPEAMFIQGGENYIDQFDIDETSVCGIGPGLGTDSETEKSLLEFLKQHPKPLLLDADALNIISKDQKNLQLIPKKSIITPHPKEFERLFGVTKNSFERIELARKKANELQIYIVLKDHHTQIITPEGNVFYNITGNSGLAKGGSGDILTGVITSFLAQGYSEENAAVFGVWFHGKAAECAAEKYSKESMLPTDAINEFGNVFEELNKNTSIKL
ncbi:bifunctional ADP-dependent NAD(P)H-hydrate dehydratase/NAD(P)H-hydrate epimerase [Chryseobacterium limigenitum]|uniref:Bifunctional NAD(P)H-hydrate repair enzyme n=1 Tax=Chryseobacterium limigenitum TaxID=1612149 RepID=A0A1K2IUK7_9FLAO|nr:bifunctional ADP-dependent NAD(P)H-hydrate dehydratase/NAD(P)H-hydrate epimerase [Chryseobacterium limigenitum]SFZ96047.1 NAD(P)H-hydrate epimerase [Chryseobacterium limigenitum]